VERLVKAGATVLRIKDEPDMGLYAAAMQGCGIRPVGVLPGRGLNDQ